MLCVSFLLSVVCFLIALAKKFLSFKILNLLLFREYFFFFVASLKNLSKFSFTSVFAGQLFLLLLINDMDQAPPPPYLEALAVSTKLCNKSLKYMVFIP